jgi:hypothetical protein
VRWHMPREWFPSSYECDCGHQLHFCEGTVNEMKRMSLRKEVRLAEGEHVVVFHRGMMVDVLCPKRARRGTTRTGRKKP